MKKYSLPFSSLALLAGLLPALSGAEEVQANLGKAADNKIYAQQLVNQLMAMNDELLVVGLHAVVPGQKDETMIATNLDRVGKKDDDDDIAVANEHKTICGPNLKESTKFEVQVPLKDSKGNWLGAAAGFVFKYHTGDDEVVMHIKALKYRDYLAANTPDLATLLGPGQAMVPSAWIKIPDSKGKFDFISVDAKRNRVLGAHEKDGTFDIMDIGSQSVLARLKVGPAVGSAIDPVTGKYFVSVQDDQRVAIIDSDKLAEVGSIKMDGDTDAIIFDAKDRHVFVTNDNGKFLWVIDADAQKVIASIPIPSAPECMVHDADADRVYLNLKAANEVAVIDTKTNTIVALWPTLPAKGVHGIAFDPATGHLFTSGDNKVLAELDVKTGKVIGTADIVAGVDQIAFDPSTKHVYCMGIDKMTVLDTSGEQIASLGAVRTSDNGKNVAVDPNTHAMWTTFTDGTNSYAKSFVKP